MEGPCLTTTFMQKMSRLVQRRWCRCCVWDRDTWSWTNCHVSFITDITLNLLRLRAAALIGRRRNVGTRPRRNGEGVEKTVEMGEQPVQGKKKPRSKIEKALCPIQTHPLLSAVSLQSSEQADQNIIFLSRIRRPLAIYLDEGLSKKYPCVIRNSHWRKKAQPTWL